MKDPYAFQKSGTLLAGGYNRVRNAWFSFFDGLDNFIGHYLTK